MTSATSSPISFGENGWRVKIVNDEGDESKANVEFSDTDGRLPHWLRGKQARGDWDAPSSEDGDKQRTWTDQFHVQANSWSCVPESGWFDRPAVLYCGEQAGGPTAGAISLSQLFAPAGSKCRRAFVSSYEPWTPEFLSSVFAPSTELTVAANVTRNVGVDEVQGRSSVVWCSCGFHDSKDSDNDATPSPPPKPRVCHGCDRQLESDETVYSCMTCAVYLPAKRLGTVLTSPNMDIGGKSTRPYRLRLCAQCQEECSSPDTRAFELGHRVWHDVKSFEHRELLADCRATCVCPEDHKRTVTLVFPPLGDGNSGRYSIMHAKLMLLEFDTHLRVVISSLNQSFHMWRKYLETLWVQDLPIDRASARRSSESDEEPPVSSFPSGSFLSDLCDFVTLLGCDEWTLRLRTLPLDVSQCDPNVHLVVSAPPRVLTDKPPHMRLGVDRLEQVLAEATPACNLGRDCPIAVELWSIGGTSREWNTAMVDVLGQDQRASAWGKFGVHHNLFVNPKGRQFYWRTDEPMFRLHITPDSVHSKTMRRVCNELCASCGRRHGWVYVGSHNWSNASWGSLGRKPRPPMNWELGILWVSPACDSLTRAMARGDSVNLDTVPLHSRCARPEKYRVPKGGNLLYGVVVTASRTEPQLAEVLLQDELVGLFRSSSQPRLPGRLCVGDVVQAWVVSDRGALRQVVYIESVLRLRTETLRET